MRAINERSWLLTFADPDEWVAHRRAHDVRERLSREPLPGLVEVVLAARSLLVVGDDRFDPRQLYELEQLATAAPITAAREHRLPVEWNGADLTFVAQQTALTMEALVARLCATRFTVGWLGFLPGFPYLYGLPPELIVPRRASPRMVVPPGSVALAAHYVGIYPSSSPGGWNLLGHTDTRLFDPALTPAALLQPGDTVQFMSR